MNLLKSIPLVIAGLAGALFLAILVVMCIDEGQLRRVRVGMSDREVKSTVGEPARVDRYENLFQNRDSQHDAAVDRCFLYSRMVRDSLVVCFDHTGKAQVVKRASGAFFDALIVHEMSPMEAREAAIWRQVERGMSKPTVVGLVGPPDRVLQGSQSTVDLAHREECQGQLAEILVYERRLNRLRTEALVLLDRRGKVLCWYSRMGN